MGIPIPTGFIPAIGHCVYILFNGDKSIAKELKSFGMLFDTEVDNAYCILVDPRFDASNICNYIVELGGSVYVSPPNTPPIFE